MLLVRLYLSGTYLMLNYVRPQIFGPVGVQAGATLLHLSNAKYQRPLIRVSIPLHLMFGLTAALDDDITRLFKAHIETFEEDINKK